MSGLTVNFKAPVMVLDAVRTVVKATHLRTKTEQTAENWEKMSEEERKASNQTAHANDILARFFEVTL